MLAEEFRLHEFVETINGKARVVGCETAPILPTGYNFQDVRVVCAFAPTSRFPRGQERSFFLKDLKPWVDPEIEEELQIRTKASRQA